MNRRDFVRAIPGAALAVPLVAREAWAGTGDVVRSDNHVAISESFLLELGPIEPGISPALTFETSYAKPYDRSGEYWKRAHEVSIRGPSVQYIRMLREHGYEFLIKVTPEQEVYACAHAGWLRRCSKRPFGPFRWAGFVDTEHGRCLHIVLRRCDASDRELASRSGAHT